MITFYMLSGRDKLFLYEKDGVQYAPVYLDGRREFPYTVNRAQDTAARLLEQLTDKFNLDDSSEIKLILVESGDPIHSEAMKNALGSCVAETYPLEEAVVEAAERLIRDGTPMIGKFGVNFDGVNYRIENGTLVQHEFSLLAYSLDADGLMKLLN